jgi:aminopeptidase N
MKRLDYLPPAFLLEQVDLTFRIFADQTLVTSNLGLARNPDPKAPPALVLDGDGLDTRSVALDGRRLALADLALTPTTLTFDSLPDHCVLTIETRVLPRENKALSGLYESGALLCTQCEAEGFRRITWFPDRPDVMAPYRVRIEADRATRPVLLSNGNRIDAGDLPDGRHYTVWEDPFKKPSYLFALVAGDLEKLSSTFTTKSGRQVDLILYTEHGSADQCVWALESLKRAMKWDEDTYGREYDLDLFHIVAVSDFNMGAMENKSLNIFNTAAVFASQEKSTDEDFVWVEAVVAHEYFHNWTGNRITCRDWFQLTLKEGLTVFRDQSFTQDLHSAAVARIDDVSVLRSAQFAEDQSPMAHPIRPEEYQAIDNFYTVTVYEKGAEVIGMLKTLLGADRYRKATDLYFERHDGQAVTCEDFVKCMEDASGLDLTAFRLWYSQAGTPLVKASTTWDAAARRFTLRLEQSFPTQPKNLPVVIPVRFGLVGPDGRPLALDAAGSLETVLVFDRSSQEFVFDHLPARPVPSLFRGFSAPVNLETDLTDDELTFLVAHDPDGFNRYEAAFALKKKDLLGRIARASQGEANPEPTALASLFRTLLDDPSVEPGLKARLLTLPGQGVLEQALGTVDPLLVHRVRKETRVQLARLLEPEFLATYKAHHRTSSGVSFPTDEEMAHRALKNLALGYLTALGTDEAFALAALQYRQASTMTDRMAALEAFADTGRPERAELLGDFYQRYRSDKLVIDEWFGVQATAEVPDLFDHLAALERHPDFDPKNPNRARSLYGRFRRGNVPGFHEATGRGYRFVAGAILAIDAFNPQIASGLTQAFQNWKRYAEPYRSLQKAALESIAAKAGLSENVAELAGKYLGA